MPAVDLLRTLKLYAIVTLMAAGCTFAVCGVVVAKSKPVNAEPAASAAPVTPPPGATWFIFVADLHLDFRNTGRLRKLLKTIASELIHEGDVFGVRSSGPPSLSIDLTSDRTLLETAIKKTTGNGPEAL